MRILLYYPNSENAFVKYDRSCEVVINPETNRVNIIKNGFIEKSFELVKKCAPVWTDETKCCSEVLVKIVVQPIKQEVPAQ